MSFFVFLVAHSQKSVFEVARSGSVNEIKALMAINADTINAVEDSGYLPLTLACYNGNNEVALFLVNHVKDINGNSKMGTPLMAAVYKNDELVVQALLAMNVNPNIADANGTTALHYAIMSRNEAIVKLLIDANADVAFTDKRGNSALDYGKMTQNQNIINLLKKNKI
ncbi:ankyrin repeat domain-containing protein [Gelidibacter maritimus]|uniref:Ankyrin repeat domain-containing protein n=1 Tax=Gelidibacter maritimus TaxID=2761487 RepID=A0A7W2M221_9FLAO|nr:ankyrin repeat domain-containing protein [Gelidibacter maritimus]MBA6151284.1 ankyrin repeat domain-containing protein [Gelidibacter maritimus]